MIVVNRYVKLLFSFLCCLFASASFCQLQQPNRYEKERTFRDEDFSVVSLKTEGLALIREKNKYKSGNQAWEVILLDTALTEKWTLELEIDIQNRLIGFEHAPGFFYLLFSKNQFKGEMEIMSISIPNREVTRYEIKSELNIQLTHFSKVGENFIFGGYVNLESAVLLYAPAINNLKIIPGFFQKNTELVDLRVNQNQTFNTLLIDRGDINNRKIIFRTFDSSGKQLLEDETVIDNNITLLTGICSTLESEDLMVIGTWGKKNNKQASGFYTLIVNPFEEQKITFTYFGLLTHYLDYLKPKKATKIKTKTKLALEDGKIPDFTNYVMPFKIVEHSRGFLLLAESYNPSSSTNHNQPMPYSSYSNLSQYGYYPSNRMYGSNPSYSYGNNVQNSEEIKTIESAVLAFDGKGSVLWDYSLPLSGIKMPSLEQICDFTLIDSNIYFLYKNESELKVKTINLDDYGFEEKTEKVKLLDLNDELGSESKQLGSIRHWFGNNFYVWGHQSIRNKTKTDKTREIFYVNKVLVH